MVYISYTKRAYLFQVMPLVLAYILLVIFYLIWCVLTKYIGNLPFELFDKNVPLISGRIIFANYSTAATLLALIVTEFTVIFYSGYTVWKRRSFGYEFCNWTNFILPSLILCFISFVTFQLLNWWCDSLLKPINAIGREWFECLLGKNLFDLLEYSLEVSAVLTFSAVSAVIAAACTLDPKLAWNILFKKQPSNCTIQKAMDEIAWQIRWMKYYLFMAAAFLVIGILCQKIWTALPLAYIPDEEYMAAKAFQEAANAIVVYYAVFFVLLLLVVFLPIGVRLQRAGTYISEIGLPDSNELERRRWMVNNKLTLSMAETIQSIIAVLSPIAIPMVIELYR